MLLERSDGWRGIEISAITAEQVTVRASCLVFMVMPPGRKTPLLFEYVQRRSAAFKSDNLGGKRS